MVVGVWPMPVLSLMPTEIEELYADQIDQQSRIATGSASAK